MVVVIVKSSDDFFNHLKETDEYDYVFVDFFAEWCQPCKRIAPFIEKQAETYERVKCLSVDVDKIRNLSRQFEITAMPTFLLFKVGEMVPTTKIVGASESKISDLFKNLS